MTGGGTTAGLTTGVELLERAMGYTLGGLLLVTRDAMSNPTPCRDWDLRELLLHMNISLRLLHRSITLGDLDAEPSDPVADHADMELDPVARLRVRASELIAAWANARGDGEIWVADWSVPSATVAVVGAVEVAVHGWDVAQACGADRPVPAALARDLLELCPVLVGEGSRPAPFGPRVDVPDDASPSDRLVGFLGRCPR